MRWSFAVVECLEVLGPKRLTHLHISAYLCWGVGFREVDTTTHLGLPVLEVLASKRMTHLHISAYLFWGVGFREADTTTHLGLPVLGCWVQRG